MAGLPGNRACVGVGPPFSCSGPSIGLVLSKSTAGLRLHVFALSRFFPWETKRPEQLASDRAVLPAMMVFLRLTATPNVLMPPPAPAGAWFPVIVLLSIDGAALLATPPPPDAVVLVLPVTVVLMRVRGPMSERPPPSP